MPQQTIYAQVSHTRHTEGYAVIYRADLQQLKDKSLIKTVILDKALKLVEEEDYFEFIEGCSESSATNPTDFEGVKASAMPYIIESIQQQELLESASQHRLIEIKIDSISNYFEKQINKVKRLQQNVKQEDIQRMRIAEVENLKQRRDEKITELEEQKRVSSRFEILGILGVE